jgi:hypothetical protein
MWDPELTAEEDALRVDVLDPLPCVRRPWTPRATKVVGLVAGLLVLLSSLALAPEGDDPGPRCPGARGSLMAPRGGCLREAPTDHR